MSDPTDAIADLRVLVASVGGDVKAVLAKLDDQNRRIEKAEGTLTRHEQELRDLWEKIHRWAGAAAIIVTLFSSGFIYLIYMIFFHH